MDRLLTSTLYLLGGGISRCQRSGWPRVPDVPAAPAKRPADLAPPKPPQYTFMLTLGVALGVLVFVKLFIVHRQAFGETMMFAYYAYLFPMSRTIRRGFYADGIWADTAFIPYNEVGGHQLAGNRGSGHAGDHLAAATTWPAVSSCPATSTARPAGSCGTRSASTPSTSAAPASTSASTTSGMRRKNRD